MRYILLLLLSMLIGCTNIYYQKEVVVAQNHAIRNAYRSVGMLKIQSPTGEIRVATGFAYDKDNIITANHFCISALNVQIFESHTENISLVYHDSDHNTVEIKGLVVENMSRVEDLCMLKKENHGLIPLPIVNDYSKINIRDEVTIIGAPLGTVIGEFSGRVMSVSYDGLGSAALKGKLVTSCPIVDGISGSPVILNSTGEVIGVLVIGVPFEHLGFSVRGDILKEFVE